MLQQQQQQQQQQRRRVVVDRIVNDFFTHDHYSTPRQLALLRIRAATRSVSSPPSSSSVVSMSKYITIGTETTNRCHQNDIDNDTDTDDDDDSVGGGLAALIVPVIGTAVSEFMIRYNHYQPRQQSQQQPDVDKFHPQSTTHHNNNNSNNDGPCTDVVATQFLHRMLRMIHTWVGMDTILAQEFGRHGLHPLLIQLIALELELDDDDDHHKNNKGVENDDIDNDGIDNDNDDHNRYLWMMEDIQNIASEIAVASGPCFPITTPHPLTLLEVQQRVPILMSIATKTIQEHNDDDDDDDNDGGVSDTIDGDTNNNNHHRMVPPPQQQHPTTTTTTTTNRTTSTIITILIHQICLRQSAQVDVGFVLWPSAVALSSLIVNHDLLCRRPRRWELDHSCTTNASTPPPLTILELGAGCGLSGLVAAQYLRRKQHTQFYNVVLTDFNELVLENLQRNIHLNDLSDVCSVIGLDFYQQLGTSKKHWRAMNHDHHNSNSSSNNNSLTTSAIVVAGDQVDIVIAADIICQPSDAIAVANTLYDTLKSDGVAYIVCANAKHRFGVDHLRDECQRVGLTVSTQTIASGRDDDVNTDDERGELSIRLSEEDVQNLEKTAGYVHGMELTLFVVQK